MYSEYDVIPSDRRQVAMVSGSVLVTNQWRTDQGAVERLRRCKQKGLNQPIVPLHLAQATLE